MEMNGCSGFAQLISKWKYACRSNTQLFPSCSIGHHQCMKLDRLDDETSENDCVG